METKKLDKRTKLWLANADRLKNLEDERASLKHQYTYLLERLHDVEINAERLSQRLENGLDELFGVVEVEEHKLMLDRMSALFGTQWRNKR